VHALERALSVTAEVSFGPERTGDIKRSVADISKANTELGWEPVVSFESGVSKMIKEPE
jgi:nucleoside-diphosphate-sugar epimerase